MDDNEDSCYDDSVDFGSGFGADWGDENTRYDIESENSEDSEDVDEEAEDEEDYDEYSIRGIRSLELYQGTRQSEQQNGPSQHVLDAQKLEENWALFVKQNVGDIAWNQNFSCNCKYICCYHCECTPSLISYPAISLSGTFRSRVV